MCGELRTALNNVASQFGQLELQLEESGHTEARNVINDVKKLHEIDDFCAAHRFARNTGSLVKALAFNTSDYSDDFVNAVVIGATGYACGYYPTISAPDNSTCEWKHAMSVVIRNKLGLFVPTAEVEKAYSEIRSACGWIAEEYPEDARKRLESAVTIYDAVPIFAATTLKMTLAISATSITICWGWCIARQCGALLRKTAHGITRNCLASLPKCRSKEQLT